ncbi:MAG: hypothetical protein ACREIF_02640 [Chthoniobacterales bacterium]
MDDRPCDYSTAASATVPPARSARRPLLDDETMRGISPFTLKDV